MVAALALILRGTRVPLARSLVSVVEIPSAVFLIFYIDLAVRLFAPFVVRYGYIVAAVIFWAIPVVSLSEVGIHFPLLTRSGKFIVAAVAAAIAALLLIDYLSRLLG